MSNSTPFADLRDELAEELRTANADLVEAVAAQKAAEEARAVALAAWEALQAAIAKLPLPPASALASRLRWVEDDMRTADGRVAMANATVANARAHIVDLELSLEQHAIITGLSCEAGPDDHAALAQVME